MKSKKQNNLAIILCCSFVVLYVIFRAWNQPNLEAFNQGEKIIRIRDVIGSKGLVEITFRKPQLAEGENLTKYEIVLKKGLGIIGIKQLTTDLNKDLYKYTINDVKILDNTDYSIHVLAKTDKNTLIESVPFNFRTNERNKNIITLNQDIVKDMEENRKIFLMQETEQNTQNRVITDLKKRLDTLRNDIVVLKNKDKDEYRNVRNVVQGNDSVSQIYSMPDGQSQWLKNYNVNLNLE